MFSILIALAGLASTLPEPILHLRADTGIVLDSKGGGLPNRLRMRSPSFCNLSILPELMKGHLVSDVPAILGSFDFVMGECDR